MEPTYVTANDRERARLEALLDKVSEKDLGRRLPNGLTVAEALIHLAFWDTYAMRVLQKWQTDGYSASNTHFEAINAAVQALAANIPDSEVPRMARESALAVDREVEKVPATLAAIVEENGKRRTLERALHRGYHLDQIERLLLLK